MRLLKRSYKLIICDLVVIHVALLFALWIEFRSLNVLTIYSFVIPLSMANTVIALFLFWRFKLYSSILAFFSFKEFSKLLICCALSAFGILMCIIIFNATRAINYSMLYFLFLASGTSLPRVYRRFERYMRQRKVDKNMKINNIMVIGAGFAGSAIIKEITDSQHLKGNIVCCIDDDLSKKGKHIHGIEIVGGRDFIEQMSEKYEVDEIIIAMPSMSSKIVRDILEICKNTGCHVKTLPGLYQLLNGEVAVSRLRDVEVNDLLARDPIAVNLDEIMDYVVQKTVLVTGGGGSIGSELCRQIANYNPAKLVIFDIYENSVYELQQDLKKNHPDLDFDIIIGSVRDYERMSNVCQFYSPDIVYHAAAHKHVPFMEDSPNEAIKNNVFGTLNTAKAAAANGTKRFVLISSDKAVNPSSVMGATKRICEMIIQQMDTEFDTEFVAVRFGNVLDSAGSVFPLFKKQIQEGGPVTITHKDVVRYFMTIPEAVSLILQAGCYAKGGEIFVLDMGVPVRIDDMARNLIKLSGYVPDVDIDVVYTGLRPGEKLFEELLLAEEGLLKTDNELIFVANPIVYEEKKFFTGCEELKVLAYNNSTKTVTKIREMVDMYKTPD
ncbi:MAG: polysaccharide biosynthesis protein [Oscillospiraceae bacterium]|nr:polysaccharide biosynthesis protein [Oscillospiraceae bacterium]